MVRRKLTDLIPLWGLYDLAMRRGNELDSYEAEALRENDRVARLSRAGEITPLQQKRKCDEIVEKMQRRCRNLILYSATVSAYNIAAAYSFYRLMESLAR